MAAPLAATCNSTDDRTGSRADTGADRALLTAPFAYFVVYAAVYVISLPSV